jgi:ketosteroid isomerase-like protein
MVVRRTRELFEPTSAVAVKLGTIDVQVLGPDLAIASYPVHYSLTRTLPNGRRYRVDVPFGRATQIFLRDNDGELRIIHEHVSSAAAVQSEDLPEGE